MDLRKQADRVEQREEQTQKEGRPEVEAWMITDTVASLPTYGRAMIKDEMQTPEFVSAVMIALWLAGSAPAAEPGEAGRVRVQLVTGGHSHDISFYDAFHGNPEFKISVNPHPGAFHSDIRKSVDVLVLYDLA